MPAIAYIKTDCEHCGDHIEYPSELAGQSVQCPHCQQTTTLPVPFIPAPVPPRSVPPPLPTTQPPSRIARGGNYFHWIAASLLVIGLFFLRENEDEQFENKMLSHAYAQHAAVSQTYESTSQLYRLGGTSRSSVDRVEARYREANEEIEKQKQKISELANARRFKMCLFFAGAAVFFVAGVMQASKSRA